MTATRATRFLGWTLGLLLAAAPLACASADAPPAQDARAAATRSERRSAPPKEHEAPADLAPDVRYVVRLGVMRDGAGGEDFRRMLHDATRTHARTLKEVAVIESEGSLAQQAAERHLPVIMLDGLVTVTETPNSNGLRVRASVEFSVRRDHVLKAILTGAATATGSIPTISDRGRRVLQEGAIDGAVQVALRDADRGLTVAAR